MNDDIFSSNKNTKNQAANEFAPIISAQRLHHIDSMRGFALFGIFLVNMLMFQYGMFGYEFIFPTLNFADQTTHIIIEWFFQGSFYPIFSMLFGFGATMMWENASKVKRPFYFVYTRRLFILTLIGTIHLYFIWDGDILLSYAITGLVFMLFIKNKQKTMLIWAFILAFLTTAPGLIPGQASVDGSSIFESIVAEESAVLSEGSYTDTLLFRLKADPFENIENGHIIALTSFIIMFMQLLMLFLIGGFLAKKRWFHHILEFRQTHIRLTIFGLLVGLALKSSMVFTTNASLNHLGYFLGGPLVGLGLMAGFSILYLKIGESNLFIGFGYVGRMALTNYLMQSVIMTTIFYGYGFGFFGELGTTLGALIVIVVFVAQIFFSKWWLDRFKFGPIEWAWRCGTYFKKQPLKR